MTASIMVPSPSMKIILLYCPIISTASDIITVSPSSFVPSKSRKSSLSNSGCLISRSLAPESLFLRSIQSMGGTLGFSGEDDVILIRGLFARAEMRSFFTPSLERMESMISSFEGWYILSTLLLMRFFFSSFLICLRNAPSSAIFLSPSPFIEYHYYSISIPNRKAPYTILVYIIYLL